MHFGVPILLLSLTWYAPQDCAGDGGLIGAGTQPPERRGS